MNPKRLLLLGSILLIGLIVVGWRQHVDAQAVPPTPATVAETKEFELLIQRARRITFDAWAAGDLSLFPTIFYNDPAVTLEPGYLAVIKRHRAAVETALANAQPGPRGTGSGFLSYEVAYTLEARGDPHRRAFWTEQAVYVQEALLQGDQATVTYTMNPKATLLYHARLSRVAGQWYISNLWTTGQP